MNAPIQPQIPKTSKTKKNLIAVAVVIGLLLAYAGYSKITKDGNADTGAQSTGSVSQSSGTKSGTTPTTSGKGTDWLLSEFVKIAKQTNPDLSPEPAQKYGELSLLKFSCVITADGMKNFIGTMNSPNDPNRKMNETDLTAEQIKILAVQMKEDCETANQVTVGK